MSIPRGKVLIGKIGLDGHESGAKLVGRILRDGGYEVIYTGRRQTVAGIVKAALEEDVDLIGISLLSGTHLAVAAELMRTLEAEGDPPPVVMGGIIPPDDHDPLLALGVRGVLGPGASSQQILDLVDELIQVDRNVPMSNDQNHRAREGS